MNLSECATVSHLFSWLNGKVNVIPIFTMVYKITQPINYPDSRVIKVKEQLPGFFIKKWPHFWFFTPQMRAKQPSILWESQKESNLVYAANQI